MRATDMIVLLRSPRHKAYKKIAMQFLCELLSDATKLLLLMMQHHMHIIFIFYIHCR